ncbi:MAG: DUF2993 domain-containing protein [Armatimonadota bacterium]|nr:DUF2993 domain-containing protein [Armatimonadota bacterium]MDR7533301.1 DUF2993 domain-containing protein [Armatimonadota bacterium]MDR7536580.1 DUF2993 domain-containing protein [Armatimonadota bacterium]
MLLLAALGIVVAGAVTAWLPSTLLARQVAAALQPHLVEGGTARVTARATAWGLAAGRVDRLTITATGVRLGELAAQRMTAHLEGVRAARDGRGWRVASVAAGQAECEVGAEALQQLLVSRGVERAQVAIAADAVAASGEIRVGIALVPVRVRAQPYSTGRDLRFRILALDFGGVEVPPALAETVLAAVQPAVALDGLPWSLHVTRVDTDAGVIRLVARVGGAP